MAAPLVDSFGRGIPRRIAAMVSAVAPSFDGDAFVAAALDGHEPLGLMNRGRHWAAALRTHLPDDDGEAIALLTRSLGPVRPADAPGEGMTSFLYLPHSFVIAAHGVGHFEIAMEAQHALTQRFTAEFCIRPFVDHDPERTFARLAEWTSDPNDHVRRLVSEGTRPRLPWAPRLRALQRDPTPSLPLLERLRDDPSEYVRRSVANHLNDIGKDHPDLLVATARRWAEGAGPERLRLLRHALRSRVAAGDPGALEALGFTPGAPADVRITGLDPAAPRIGDALRIDIAVTNTQAHPAGYAVRLRVTFARPRRTPGVRVFNLGERDLDPGETALIAGRVSLRQHTTRTHHPGRHGLEVLVNGVVRAERGFDLR